MVAYLLLAFVLQTVVGIFLLASFSTVQQIKEGGGKWPSFLYTANFFVTVTATICWSLFS